MPGRVRSYSKGNFPRGKKTDISTGSKHIGANIPIKNQTITDVTGGGYVDKSLTITSSETISCTPISGEIINLSTQAPRIRYEGFMPVGFEHIRNSSMTPPSNASSFHVPRILAQANPSRPYVDSMIFVGELRDFPRMGKDIWHQANRLYKGMSRRMSHRERLDRAFKNAMREVGHADEHFVANQFGWLPFVNDVMKYTEVGDVVEKRFRQLKNMQRTGSSSRNVTIENLGSNSTSTIPLDTVWYSLDATLKRAYSTKVWGSGKFILEENSPIRKADDQELMHLARKAVMGLHVDGSTAWNLMPWSWLIDWGTNVGDLIESSRNIIGAKSSGSVCVMTRQSYATEIRMKVPPGQTKIRGGNALGYVLSRKREVFKTGFILPEMGVQILNARQSAILGSLATMRAKRL